jgi:hypothetical protein
VKKYAYDTAGTFPAPSPSSIVAQDTGVIYTMKFTPNYNLLSTSPYDFFIVEYPKPEFGNQSYTIQCDIGTCLVTRGNNWVIWKPATTCAKNV